MHKSLAFVFLILLELVFTSNSYSQRTFMLGPEEKKVDHLKKVISENGIETVLAYDYPHNEYDDLAEAGCLADSIIFSNDSITIKGLYFENGHFIHYVYSRAIVNLYRYMIADLPAECGMTEKGLLLFFNCANTIYTTASFDTRIKNNYSTCLNLEQCR